MMMMQEASCHVAVINQTNKHSMTPVKRAGASVWVCTCYRAELMEEQCACGRHATRSSFAYDTGTSTCHQLAGFLDNNGLAEPGYSPYLTYSTKLL
jgi:hypothetical protein